MQREMRKTFAIAAIFNFAFACWTCWLFLSVDASHLNEIVLFAGLAAVGCTYAMTGFPGGARIPLLVLLIPLLGIGSPPAIAALFLYGLLPIVRNTHAGLIGIPGPLKDAARALGLPARARLRLIEMPLAMPYIVAGIKTSAVIAVGTATVGALVGAGGFGQPILTGIRLDDFGLILQGAVPAAAMAIGLEALLGAVERRVVPRGLRARARPS
jgi:osmoprotectant transport system permease protein